MSSSGFWKLLNDLEDCDAKSRLIELFEQEHGDSLALMMTNEAQKLQLEELNLELQSEIEKRKKQELKLLELTIRLEEKNDELERLSYIDGLTGVANRRYFDNRIDEEWKRGTRDSLPVSIIMIDIDHFKSFNDSYGHLVGDDCLKQVAASLRKALKRGGDFVARYGGEEFAVVLPGADIEVAERTAEYLQKKVVELQIEHSGSPVHDAITISIGVASAQPKVRSTPEDLIHSADKALYKAKANGRNCIMLAD